MYVNRVRFPKFTLKWRLVVGYAFAAIAFGICGLIEAYVLERCSIDKSLKTDDYYFQKCAYPALDNTIWIIPYFFLTCGEVLVSISGLNLVYEEVGKRTKSSSTALWLLTSSAGSLIAKQLYEFLSPGLTVDDEHKVTYVGFYYTCAGVIAAALLIQGVISYFYTLKKDRLDSKLA